MTRREEIIELLKKKPMRLSDIAELYENISTSDISNDLKHIRQSLRHKSELKVLFQPATCLKCGFMFTDKIKKLTKPHKCPNCKNTYIEEAVFKIE